MLKDKVAVITGSTSGIGEGYARALAKEGCHLVINGFGDEAEIEALRSSFESEFGVKCLYNPADMTKPDEIAAMFDMAVAE
ncbi:MAG: SDR family NAD(P)-dependent oxidoreductase, partial [Sneathiella sp.]